MRSLLLAIPFALVASLGASPSSNAQSYPSRPVTIVVPYSAGGPTDTLGRVVGDRMRKPLGQTVLVDNTTGAGGSIAVGKVVRAAPDGYTLGIGHWGSHVVNGAYYTLPFNLLTDLQPVAMIATNPQVIISKSAVPAKNLKELLAWIRANEDKLLVGSGGVAASSHMGGIYFQHLIGAKFQYVHYRGGAPAMQALLGGEIDVYVTQLSNITGQLGSGRIRAYAVTAKTRQAAAPEIPTVDEAGLPGFHTAIWHAFWLPKGTPRDIVMKLNAAIVEALADQTVRQRFADLGQEIPARAQQTPEALGAYHKEEIDKWFPMIKAAGLKAE
jgi:tripartite-type tricarboxylate transporter receptor subunit TctC